jgi:hypothetical protein
MPYFRHFAFSFLMPLLLILPASQAADIFAMLMPLSLLFDYAVFTLIFH